MAEMAALLVLQKMGGLLFGRRGRLTHALHRRKVIELFAEANAAGAGLVRICAVIGIYLRTLKRWRKTFWVMGTAWIAVKAVPAQWIIA